MKTFAVEFDKMKVVRLSCPRCWNGGHRAVLLVAPGESTPDVKCPKCRTCPPEAKRSPAAAKEGLRFLTTRPYRGAPAGRVVLLGDYAIPVFHLVPLNERAAEAQHRALTGRLRTRHMSPVERDLIRPKPILDVVPASAYPEIDLRRDRAAPSPEAKRSRS